MAIEFTDDEVNALYNAGFTDEDLQYTIDDDRKNGLSDDVIKSNILNAINVQPVQTQQPMQEQPKAKKGIDLTPSGLINKASSVSAGAVATPFLMLKDGLGVKDAYNKAMQNQQEWENNMPSAVKTSGNISDFMTDMAVYGSIPGVNIGSGLLGKAGNYAINNGLVNAGIGALDSLKLGKNPVEGALLGGGIGLATPPILKGTGWTLGKIGKLSSYLVPGLKPETVQRAINPNSKAVDLSNDTAENLLLNTTERIKNNYNEILNEKGNEVGRLLKKLPDTQFNANDLFNGLKPIYDNYSLSSNEALNPAINATKRELATIQDLLGIKTPEQTKQALEEYVASQVQNPAGKDFGYSKEMEEEAFDILSKATGKSKVWLKSQLNSDSWGKGIGKRKDYIEKLVRDYTGDNLSTQAPELLKNAQFYNVQNIDDIGAEAEILDRIFEDISNRSFKPYGSVSPEMELANQLNSEYSDILKNIAKNPNSDTYNEAYKFANNLENRFNDVDGIQKYYFNKADTDITNIDNIVNPKVSPKELYDINKNISDMVRWDLPEAKTKNDILEQIYGNYASKISDLSPELKEANKVYSDLMDFRKNEGVNQILSNRNNLDTASSKLKNYNSTVTKGNTNRNIQDLENTLVKNGYEPFLNDIDDINAAMEINNTAPTGINPFGLLQKGKEILIKPSLFAIRGINKSGIPQAINPIAEKLLTPLMIKSTVPSLEGGVQYYENR